MFSPLVIPEPYDASTFSDMEDAFSALLSELTAEADVFFFVQQIYAGRLHGWMALQDMGASVVDLQRGTGLRGWVNRTFRTSGRLNSALIELAGFETNRVLADEAVRSDYVDTYSADNRPFLRELVDAAREELPGFPTDQITGLLRLFETRRLSGLQVNALLVSGITGGVIGALIAALFH